MQEASPLKYYFAKYFFLAFGIMQWTCGTLLFLQENVERGRNSALVFFILGLTFIALYLMISAKLKRVAIGKKHIAIMTRGKTNHYEWPDVKHIRAVPYFNIYSLKLKGKKELIYFLPLSNFSPLLGFLPNNSDLADSLRKKLK